MGSVTLFSHTKRKRRLKNDRPCKPSWSTIKCIRGMDLVVAGVFRFGPKYPLLVYFLGGGVLAIVVAVIPATSSYTLSMVKNAIAIMARMCLLGCMSTVSFFTAELFPTVIRNSAFGLCAAAMHVGGMASHELFFLVRERSRRKRRPDCPPH